MIMMENDVKDDLRSVPPPEAIVSASSDRSYLHRRIIAIFWIVAVGLGAINTWAARHAMNADGISYLDMGDGYLRGDWKMAINAYWSPLYSWLLGVAMFILKPSPFWEFPVAHLINFIIYLSALGCFHFFLCSLIRYQRERVTNLFRGQGVTLPKWAWLALGYTLFIWSSLELITLRMVTPDMCVSACVYLASGIILRIRMGSTQWLTFVLLGVTLGFAYLAKAPMFPLAFVFLGVSLCSVGDLRMAVPRVLVTLLVFLSIASPFILGVSMAKGRLTFGDSGKLTYAWFVSGVPVRHWQGESPESGTPRHPTRKIFAEPEIYEFVTPIGGTYPPWYDPSYWYEGVTPHFYLREQIRILVSNVQIYYDLFFKWLGVLVVGSLILLLVSEKTVICEGIKDHWNLIIPAITAIGMYSFVHVEPRFIGAFFVLLWMGVFSGVVLPDSLISRRLGASVTIAVVMVMMISIGVFTARRAYSVYCELRSGESTAAHVHWDVADGLNRMGVQPGDKVAVIGWGSWMAPWARLARVRVVAEIPHGGEFREGDKFWRADHSVKTQVIKVIANTGVKAIVAKVPGNASTTGWQRVGNTDFYAYLVLR